MKFLKASLLLVVALFTLPAVAGFNSVADYSVGTTSFKTTGSVKIKGTQSSYTGIKVNDLVKDFDIDVNPCSDCSQKLVEDILNKTCDKCDPAMRDYVKMKRIRKALEKAGYKVHRTNADVFDIPFIDKKGVARISLNLKPNKEFFNKSKAEKVQQELMFFHEVYPKVRGMSGTERYKTVEEYVRVN